MENLEQEFLEQELNEQNNTKEVANPISNRELIQTLVRIGPRIYLSLRGMNIPYFSDIRLDHTDLFEYFVNNGGTLKNYPSDKIRYDATIRHVLEFIIRSKIEGRSVKTKDYRKENPIYVGRPSTCNPKRKSLEGDFNGWFDNIVRAYEEG